MCCEHAKVYRLGESVFDTDKYKPPKDENLSKILESFCCSCNLEGSVMFYSKHQIDLALQLGLIHMAKDGFYYFKHNGAKVIGPEVKS